MGYIGVIVVFIATVISLTGDTWDAQRSGFRKVTSQGWVTFLCAIIGLAVSIYTVAESEADQRALDNKLAEINVKNDLLNIQNTNLSNQNNKLIELVNDVGVRQQELDRWRERVPLITMMEGVRLRRIGSSWTAPTRVSTGSTVQLIGFNCTLSMRFGTQAYRYNRNGENEFPVVGPSGQSMKLHIWREPDSSSFPQNLGGESECYGKVKVVSTDRTVSTESSYEP